MKVCACFLKKLYFGNWIRRKRKKICPRLIALCNSAGNTRPVYAQRWVWQGFRSFLYNNAKIIQEKEWILHLKRINSYLFRHIIFVRRAQEKTYSPPLYTLPSRPKEPHLSDQPHPLKCFFMSTTLLHTLTSKHGYDYWEEYDLRNPPYHWALWYQIST